MEDLLKQVGRVRRRLGLQQFLYALGWCLFASLLVAAALIAVDKFYPLRVLWWGWVSGAAVLGVLAAVAWTWLALRRAFDAAIELDRRFDLKERVSSSLALSEEERQSEFGAALVKDAVRRAQRIDVSERFPVVLHWSLVLPLGPAVAAALVLWLVNPAVKTTQASTREVAAVKKQVAATAKTLKDKLNQQRRQAQKEGLEEAQKLFGRLEEAVEQMKAKPEGDRSQSLSQLNDLRKEIDQRRKELGGAEQMQRQLEQLKDISRGPADKVVEAIRRGDFQQAVKQIEELKDQLGDGKLSDEEKQALADQLNEMKEKLDQMVKAQKQARDDLQRQIDRARQAGQNGEADKLQEQLDRLREKMPQMDKLDDLAKKLGQCAKCMKQGDMKDAEAALGQLQGDLQQLQQQLQEMEMLDEAQEQMAQARDQMNCGKCGGAGCKECQGDPGMGMGRGQGAGPRPEERTDVKFRDSKALTKVGPGAAVVTGETAGPNLRGDIQQELQTQVDSTRKQEADPLTGQAMPKKHREHAKEYFDRFREGE